MPNTWIVAADASRARVLQVRGPQRLVEIDNLLNPDARLQDREINTDARGRFPGGNTGEDEVGAVEHLEEAFARRVGDYLDKARTEHRYDELVLVAPPKFLGMMRKSLGKEVQKLVANQLPKDLSWFNERELEAYFRESPAGSAKESGRAP
jgi:protein required for attachment to host cells